MLQLFFNYYLYVFASHARDDSSQGYRNKVISHSHAVNIDVLSMNALEIPKAQFLLLVKNPTRRIDTESLFNDLKSGKKGEEGFQHFFKTETLFPTPSGGSFPLQ